MNLSSNSKQWIKNAVALCSLGALQLAMLYPLHRHMDLPIWDESNYLGYGESWLHVGTALPGLSMSPLYLLSYAALLKFVPLMSAVAAMKYCATIGATLALGTFLIATQRSRWLTLALVSPWVIAQETVHALPFVYHFGLAIFCLALIVARWRTLPAACILGLAVLVRMEYLLVLVPSCLIWGLLWLRRRQRGEIAPLGRRGRYLYIAVVSAAVALACATGAAVERHGWGAAGDRTWFAFQQHYANAEVQNRRFRLMNPWIDYPIVIRADFGNARSLSDAYRANPSAVVRHVKRNARRFPTAVLSLFDRDYSLAFGSLIESFAALAAGFLLFGVFAKREGSWSWPPAVRARTRDLGDSIVPLLLSPLALAPTLLVQPKTAYSVILVPLILSGIGCLSQAAIDAARDSQTAFIRAVPAVFFCAVLGVVSCGSLPFAAASPRPNVQLIERARGLLPRTRTTIVGSHATFYANYLGSRRALGIEAMFPWLYGHETPRDGIGIDTLIEWYNPDAILVSPELVRSVQFRTDSLRLLRPPNWHPVPIDAGDLLFLSERTVRAMREN